MVFESLIAKIERFYPVAFPSVLIDERPKVRENGLFSGKGIIYVVHDVKDEDMIRRNFTKFAKEGSASFCNYSDYEIEKTEPDFYLWIQQYHTDMKLCLDYRKIEPLLEDRNLIIIDDSLLHWYGKLPHEDYYSCMDLIGQRCAREAIRINKLKALGVTTQGSAIGVKEPLSRKFLYEQTPGEA